MEKNESDIIPILKVWETQAYFFNVVKAYRKGMLISVCMFMEDYMGQNIFIGLLCVIALLAGIWSRPLRQHHGRSRQYSRLYCFPKEQFRS